MGLREKIKMAKSDAEIATLLQEGAKYEYASNVTKNAWKATARKTLQTLSTPKPAPVGDSKPEVKKKRVVVKKPQ